MLRKTVAVAILVLGGAAASCSDDETLRPAEDSNTGGGGGGSGGSSTPQDASVDETDDDATPASCNDLEDDVSLVDGIAASGDPPVGTGGTVVDGTYGLTDYRIYVGTGVPGLTGKAYRSVISIADGIVQQVLEEQRSGTTLDAGTTVVRTTSSFVTSGTDLVTAAICPSSGPSATFSYTATDSRLVWSNLASGEVWTFDLRP